MERDKNSPQTQPKNVPTLKVSVLFVIPIFCFIGLWSLVLDPGAFAQNVPRFSVAETVVTANRLPSPLRLSPWSTTLLTTRELAAFSSPAEALRTVAGVDLQAYGGSGALSAVRLRGANSSQVLWLQDGCRLNSPTLGMIDAADLTLDKVERIEIVRSPLSALYGSDAVSGAINLITKKPKGSGWQFDLTSGSFNTQKYRFALDQQNWLLTGSHHTSQGFRANSDYIATDLFLKTETPLPLGKLLLAGSFYDALKGVPGVPTSETDPSSATTPNDRQKDTNTYLSAVWEGENFALRGYQYQTDQKLDPYIWGASKNQSWQNGLEWTQHWQTASGTLLYGLEGREERGRTTFSGDHQINNLAAFLQSEVLFSDNLQLVAGLRGDKHSTAGTSYNPRAGLLYRPGGDISLSLSGGSAFRAPTLNELYWDDGWMKGDAGLKPEKSVGWEGTLAREREWGKMAVSYYQATVNDLILWDWQSSTIETRARNIGEVYRQGIEFELSRQLLGGLAFVNYTDQQAVTQRSFDPLAVGKTIAYTPRVKYNAGVILGGTAVVIKHVGERWVDGYNTVKLPGYTVVDLKFSRAWERGSVGLSIANIFDAQYAEAVGNDPITFAVRNYPMPGRSYTLDVKWAW